MKGPTKYLLRLCRELPVDYEIEFDPSTGVYSLNVLGVVWDTDDYRTMCRTVRYVVRDCKLFGSYS